MTDPKLCPVSPLDGITRGRHEWRLSDPMRCVWCGCLARLEPVIISEPTETRRLTAAEVGMKTNKKEG